MSIMDRIRASRAFQRIMRVLQFLSSVISLGLFSSRIFKIATLAKRSLSTSNGAVEGILAAAAVYTLLVMLLTFCLKRGAPKVLRWILIAMDILFLIAFIVVAVLTRPNGGSSGPCGKNRFHRVIPKGQNCNLPWGTFILAILSTILHLLTAIFYEVRDHHRKTKEDRMEMDGRYANEQHGFGHHEDGQHGH